MRFMAIYKPGFEAEGPPTQKEMADMGALIAEMTHKGARVSVKNGTFTETKELRLMQDAPATAGQA